MMIESSGTAHNWKLYLVVIISGHDNASPQEWNDVKRAYREARQRIRASSLKVIFVAYNVTQSVYEQLFFLQNLDELSVRLRSTKVSLGSSCAIVCKHSASISEKKTFSDAFYLPNSASISLKIDSLHEGYS